VKRSFKLAVIVFLFVASFSVMHSCKKKPTIPTLTTLNISEITQTSAVSGGNITDNGGVSIISRGICWDNSENPTITTNRTNEGSGNGSFISNLTSLTPNIKYYVRAYATNEIGIAYGNEVTFITNQVVTPTVSTAALSSITSYTAVSGGEVTFDGGSQVTSRGVCWSTTVNPNTSNSNTSDGEGAGTFNSKITGLTSKTTYYVRAYATNSEGTSYGNEVAFTTNPAYGQIIVDDLTLSEDIVCPSNIVHTITIGASNVVFDLGGHTISGGAPGVGIFAEGIENLTIRNGIIDGFENGIFIIGVNNVIIENLTVRNNEISDPNHFIFGIHIDSSQDVVVRDSRFEFLSVAHKNVVEVYNSKVLVDNIDVHGGGVGVSFSFNQICSPQLCPNIGEVVNCNFSNIYIAGIWIACTNSVRIAGNDISTAPGVGVGIQGDAPFPGAVTNLFIENNSIHNTIAGIEFRGILDSKILNNVIRNNENYGILVRHSLGCIAPEPGWVCFYSTANVISDNEVQGNGTDLFHDEDSRGNIWERNIYETKQGVDIH
jgi:hypothetical protein